MGGRNFVQKPYSDDEKRVVQWFSNVAGIGGGEDPIGFMIASHEMLARERKDLKQQVRALQLDNDRLYAIATEYKDASRKPRDLAQEMYDLAHEMAKEAGGC